MKRAAVLFTVGLTTLLLSGPAAAGDPSGTTKSTDSESRGTQTTAPGKKPGVLAVPHHVEGSVVSVNKSANTVVIRDTKGKQFNLVADSDTAAELSRLKTGDQVEVTYKKSKDQMVATKISLTDSSRTSRTK